MQITTYFFAIAMLFSVTAAGQNQSKMKSIEIQKTVKIKADLQTVFDHVALLEKFPRWSPFLEADPTQKYEVKGADGQVGAQYHWEGNKGKDLGYQEIKAIKPGQNVLMQCDIQKPFKANPTFSYSFQSAGKYVIVTQDFHLPVKGMDKFFMKLFGAVKDIDQMNERGMELLKIACEQ